MFSCLEIFPSDSERFLSQYDEIKMYCGLPDVVMSALTAKVGDLIPETYRKISEGSGRAHPKGNPLDHWPEELPYSKISQSVSFSFHGFTVADREILALFTEVCVPPPCPDRESPIYTIQIYCVNISVSRFP